MEERWNEYQLSDLSVLRTRVVLVKVVSVEEKRDEKGVELKFSGKVHTIVDVEIKNNELKGPVASRRPSSQEIITGADIPVKAEVIKEVWNLYKLADDKVLKVKMVVSDVKRGNVYDELGDPTYNVSSTVILAPLT